MGQKTHIASNSRGCVVAKVEGTLFVYVCFIAHEPRAVLCLEFGRGLRPKTKAIVLSV